MSFCGLIKGIAPKICILCVRVKINKRSFEPFGVWISSLALCDDYRMMHRVHGGDGNHDDEDVEVWGRADEDDGRNNDDDDDGHLSLLYFVVILIKKSIDSHHYDGHHHHHHHHHRYDYNHREDYQWMC